LVSLILKAPQVPIIRFASGWCGEAQYAPARIVGGVAGDRDNDKDVTALHVSNLSLEGLEGGFLRSRCDAAAGVDYVNRCLRRVLRTASEEKEDGGGH
jgi:hypothetical protein